MTRLCLGKRDKHSNLLRLFFHKIINLGDMNEFAARSMVNVTAHIEHLEKSAIYHSSERAKWSEEEKEKIKLILQVIYPDLDLLSLSLTKSACDRILADIDSYSADDLRRHGIELRHRLDDELKNRIFFQMTPAQLAIFNNTQLAGNSFKLNFPRGNGELIEAGNCLALDRYTACVCHLMRSLEYGLIALEKALAIPRPPPGNDNTWGNVLNRIEAKKGNKKKGANYVAPSAEWQQNPDYYENIYTFLTAVKTVYRDKTFHVESTYDEPGAKKVFQTTIVVLGEMGAGLKEA